MLKTVFAKSLCAAALLAFSASGAMAHTPYLVPSNFGPTSPFVTAEAGVSESNFFSSEFPIKGAGFTLTDDQGAVTQVNGTDFKEVTVFESALPHTGTFRLSTGDRVTREMTVALVDGEWRPVRPPQATPQATPQAAPQGTAPAAPPAGGRPPQPPIPDDAPRKAVKGMTRADSYISYNKPSDILPPPTGKGLEIVPASHPSRLYSGSNFVFTVAFDGQPVSGVTYKVARAYDIYEAQSYAASGETGADGKASLTFDQPGIYLISVSRKWQDGSPESQEADPRSWTYSLTLEVTP